MGSDSVRARLGARGFFGGLSEELKNPTPSLVRIPRFLVVCSTPMRLR